MNPTSNNDHDHEQRQVATVCNVTEFQCIPCNVGERAKDRYVLVRI